MATKNVMIHYRVTQAEAERLEDAATSHKLSLSELLRSAATHYLNVLERRHSRSSVKSG